MSWQQWVTTDEAHRRASGRRRHNKRRQDHANVRRQEVERLLQRWGTSAQARVNIALVLGVSLRTINRDVRALQEQSPLPVICPTCGLPSRLDVDPTDLTDDPVELAAPERAMAKLIGMAEPETLPPRRTGSRAPCLTRPQGDDRSNLRAQTLGETARRAWGKAVHVSTDCGKHGHDRFGGGPVCPEAVI